MHNPSSYNNSLFDDRLDAAVDIIILIVFFEQLWDALFQWRPMNGK